MHTSKSYAPTALLLLLLSGFSPSVWSFCNVQEGSNWVCHPQITEQALGFLRPWALKTLMDHIDDPDNVAFQDRRSSYHFDDCSWGGGVKQINRRYLEPEFGIGAVPALSPFRSFVRTPTQPVPTFKDYPDIAGGMRSWAWALHTVQDFYSHSNWVELGFKERPNDILQSGRSKWDDFPSDWGVLRGDVMVAKNAPLPASWSAVNDEETHIPLVTRSDGRRFRLLITGATESPFDSCPSFALLPHDKVMNKDDGHRPDHWIAAQMAIAQTQHEWCRLLHLSSNVNHSAGSALLMGLLSRSDRSPHPKSTICSEAAPGPVAVKIRVSRIFVIDDKEEGGPGQINFVFALYSEDFRHSARWQTATIRVNAHELVPSAQLPKPLTICTDASSQVIATVQAWEDDGETMRGELSERDDLLSGVTRKMGSALTLHETTHHQAFMRTSDNEHQRDLEVTYQIERAEPSECPTAIAPLGK